MHVKYQQRAWPLKDVQNEMLLPFFFKEGLLGKVTGTLSSHRKVPITHLFTRPERLFGGKYGRPEAMERKRPLKQQSEISRLKQKPFL